MIKKVTSKKKSHIVLVLIVILIISLAFFSFAYIAYLYQSTYNPAAWVKPEISANVVKENDSYLITITKAKEGSEYSVYHLYIKEFLRVSIVNGNQTLILRDLTTVLNNTNSSLTFYDVDGDGMLSTGDEFVVRGNLAVEGYELDILDAPSGELLKAIPLEPTTTSSAFESEKPPYPLMLAMSITVLVSAGILVAAFRRVKRYG